MNLEIIRLGEGKVRIIRRFRGETYTDNMGSIIPVNFGEKCRIEVQSVSFRRNMPNAVRVNPMTLRQCYLDYKSSQQLRRKELGRLS